MQKKANSVFASFRLFTLLYSFAIETLSNLSNFKNTEEMPCDHWSDNMLDFFYVHLCATITFGSRFFQHLFLRLLSYILKYWMNKHLRVIYCLNLPVWTSCLRSRTSCKEISAIIDIISLNYIIFWNIFWRNWYWCSNWKGQLLIQLWLFNVFTKLWLWNVSWPK